MFNSIEKWVNFKESFTKNMKEIGYNEILKFYRTNSEWTNFYKENLFYSMSKDLGYTYNNKEYLTVDAIFYKESMTGKITEPILLPHIWIESENYREDISWNELYKLFCLNGPLKVIFTWFPEWNKNTLDDYIMNDLIYVIEPFKTDYSIVGTIGFIIASHHNSKFRFSSFSIDDSGTITDEGDLLSLE